jgi:hypothetical protein
MLGAAVLYLFALGALRDRFPAVPNLVWLAVLAGLLIAGGAHAGGALAGGALSGGADRSLRHQRIGRAAVLLGAGAFVVGVLSVRDAAEAWTTGARAVGALALCASLAALPFGVAVLRRAAPAVRARAAAAAAREAWFAAAYPSAAPLLRDDQPPAAP